MSIESANPWTVKRAEIGATRQLLADVFPGSPKFRDERYLRWYYEECPAGPALGLDAVGSKGSVAHYGAVPRTFANGAERLRLALSVNSATSPDWAGRGIFASLGREVYQQAAGADDPVIGFVGVPNRLALPPRIKRLGWRVLDQLTLTVALARGIRAPKKKVRSFAVSTPWLRSTEFGIVVRDIAFEAKGTDERNVWWPHWTPHLLQWRLANPIERYSLHLSEDVAAVSCLRRIAGLSISVLTKTFPTKSNIPVDMSSLLSAIARHDGALAIVYAGLNSRIVTPGFRVPPAWRRSPLTLGVTAVHPGPVERSDFEIDGFEFFDFDVL